MRLLSLFALVLFATFSAGCGGCVYVEAGEVGVKVYTMGNDRGDLEKVGVGRHVLGVYEDVYKFPTYKQNEVWAKTAARDESISFQTIEGLTVNADIGITYSVDEAKVLDLFRTYRRGIDEITDVFLRNHVRDALNDVASTMPVASVYGEGKAKLFDAVQTKVAAKVAPLGIRLEEVYAVNELRLPPSVIESLNAKISATQDAQKVENEVAKAKAEADKAAATARGRAESILIEAEAQAKANKLLSESITPALVEIKRIEKWDGRMPQVTGGTSGMLSLTTTSGGGK